MRYRLTDFIAITIFITFFFSLHLLVMIMVLVAIAIPSLCFGWWLYDQIKYQESLPKNHLTCDYRVFEEWMVKHPRWSKKYWGTLYKGISNDTKKQTIQN